MAPTSKYLAQSNKSLRRGQATRIGEAPGSAAQFHALAKTAQRYRLFHDGVIVRIKFEATDASGKVHKRSSTSHAYSHCLVIHFAAHPPSNQHNANRWRKQPDVDTIEILDAIQV